MRSTVLPKTVILTKGNRDTVRTMAKGVLAREYCLLGVYYYLY